MKKLTSYIGKGYVFHFVWLGLILSFLFSLFELSEQLENVGKGEYHYIHAVYYVVLTVPSKLVEFSPFASLLGAIIYLGNKARNLELLALQACGISRITIYSSLLFFALLMATFVLVFSEACSSILAQRAYKMRSMKLTEKNIFLLDQGFWAQKNNTFLHVSRVQSESLYKDIYLYSFDQSGMLNTFIYAQNANVNKTNKWRMTNVTRKHFHGSGTHTAKYKKMTWQSFLDPDQKQLLEIPAPYLSFTQLYALFHQNKKTTQTINTYRLVFWQKFVNLIAILIFPLVVLPLFMCQINEKIQLGLILSIGVLGGGLFYLLLKLLGYMALIFNIHPLTIVVLPMGFVVISSMYMSYSICKRLS